MVTKSDQYTLLFTTQERCFSVGYFSKEHLNFPARRKCLRSWFPYGKARMKDVEVTFYWWNLSLSKIYSLTFYDNVFSINSISSICSGINKFNSFERNSLPDSESFEMCCPESASVETYWVGIFRESFRQLIKQSKSISTLSYKNT